MKKLICLYKHFFFISLMLTFSLPLASQYVFGDFVWFGDKANPLIKDIKSSIDKKNGFDKIVYLSIEIRRNKILKSMGEPMLYIAGIDAINPPTKLFGNKWHGTCMIQNGKINKENDTELLLVAFQTKTDSITLKKLGFSSFQLNDNGVASSRNNIDFPINKTFKLFNNSLNYLGRITIILTDKSNSIENTKVYGSEIWREVKNEITYIQYIVQSGELKEKDLSELLLIKKKLTIHDELKKSNAFAEMLVP